MNALGSCKLAKSGYKECGIKITDLFTAQNKYEIVTAKPYLVVRTNLDNIFAFLDTGFSGQIEQSERSSHGQWGHDALDSALSDAGSHVLMVGLKSMKHFPSLLVSYKDRVVLFGAPPPPSAAELTVARSFRSFESEMFAPEITLQDTKDRRLNVLTLLDTGNPSSYIYNKAFKNELMDFGLDSTCACDVPGLESITVQDANQKLKRHSISLYVAGHKTDDTIKGVCDISECGSEHLNKVIRNPTVVPQVTVNLGNSSMAALAYFFLDFDNHKMLVPSSRSRNLVEPAEADSEDNYLYFLAKLTGGILLVFLVLAVLFR